MDYKSAEPAGQDIVLTGLKRFSLENILNCGQCFRWSGANGVYSGVARGRRLEVYLSGDALVLRNMSLPAFETVWKSYFDLERDYGALHRLFSLDETMRKALAFSPGLRVMRQEPWETLITFILSQNNHIARIKGIVARLCENFGAALPGEGFAFPSPERLAVLSEDDLAPLRCGYRSAYLLDAARRVCDGRLDLPAFFALPSEEICKQLLRVHGVGIKVAECVLLYGFGRVERFPLDVWMKRVMRAYYPEGFPAEWAEVAGIAQQFLFHYIRNRTSD
ncbi:MAG: DNA-3-methyladenine glycosylase 2 family protein [Clostridiales bacterium]|jgi:N-glycosylase/DNA lyase|nr:DNA-3-methyladenine glycosylase 2 family protein [Clostridiales bacterium]